MPTVTVPRGSRRVLLAALLAATTATRAHAQPAAAPAGGFVVLLGADTFAVERVHRTATALDGALLLRDSRLRVAYSAAVAADERLSSVTLRQWAPGAAADAPPATTLDFAFAPNDTLTVTAPGGTQRVAVAPGTLPWVNPVFGFVEQMTRRAVHELAATKADTVRIPAINLGNAERFTATAARVGADSIVLDFGDVSMRLAVAPDGTVRGGRIPAQRITIVRVATLPSGAPAAPAAAPPDYGAPAGAPYTAEEVRVPTPGGFALAGTLTLPRSKPGPNARGPVPVVVTITGSGPQTRDEALLRGGEYRLFRQLADTLGRRGIGVLRLDDRGTGASGGTFATATSRDFADDVRAALAWLRTRAATRGDVDARRLGLVGHSEGGLVAPMVAAEDSSLAAIVLMAGPAYTGRRILGYQFRNGVAGDTARADRMRDSVLAATPWMRFFADYDPRVAARRVRAPVLIVQGATDQQVTPEQADSLAAAIRAGGNAAVTVRVVPATNHLFLADPSGAPAGYAALPSKVVGPAVLGTVADWLVAELHGMPVR